MAPMATNEMSSFVGKLEIKMDINASAQEFYHVFAGSPYLASDVVPGIVQGCDLLDGEWGTAGAIILWTYILGGKSKVAKEIIEVVDSVKNLITFRVIEGDLMEDFKNIAMTVQVTPKPKGPGSIVHWHLEYEKISEEVAHPEALMQVAIVISKEVDKQLLS